MSLSLEEQALEYKPEDEKENPCTIWDVEPTVKLQIKNGVLEQLCVIKYKYKFDVKISGMWTKYGEIEAWLKVPEVLK